MSRINTTEPTYEGSTGIVVASHGHEIPFAGGGVPRFITAIFMASDRECPEDLGFSWDRWKDEPYKEEDIPL